MTPDSKSKRIGPGDPDGTTALFGQRFHTCIALTYFGLGLNFATTFAYWFPEYLSARAAISLLTFFAGCIWIILLWRRDSRPNKSDAFETK